MKKEGRNVSNWHIVAPTEVHREREHREGVSRRPFPKLAWLGLAWRGLALQVSRGCLRKKVKAPH
jgi:hypothetical protein